MSTTNDTPIPDPHPVLRHEFPPTFSEIGDGVTDDWLSEQLMSTTASLSGVQRRMLQRSNVVAPRWDGSRTRGEEGTAGGGVQVNAADGGTVEDPPLLEGTPRTVVDRLDCLGEEVSCMSLTREYHRMVACDRLAGMSVGKDTPLLSTARFAQKLGILLVRHAAPLGGGVGVAGGGSGSMSYGVVYGSVLDRYEALYRHARARAVLDVRRLLRRVAFPSAKGCTAVRVEMDRFLEGRRMQRIRRRRGRGDAAEGADDNTGETDYDYGEEEEKEDGGAGAGGGSGLASCIWFLCQLQTMHESVINHTKQDGDSNALRQPQSHRTQHRIDVLDELIRPVVERVSYHFLHNTQDTTQHSNTKPPPPPPPPPSTSSTPAGADNANVRYTSSRLDKLPEWLLHYLRDLILEQPPPQSHQPQQPQYGVHDILVHCILPVLQMVSQDQTMYTTDKPQTLPPHSTPHPTTSNTTIALTTCHYFYTAIFHLIRRVLLARNFFRHPSIVGSGGNGGKIGSNPNDAATSPLPLCHAVEQILRFDALVQDAVKEVERRNPSGGNNEGGEEGKAPRLMDVVVCPDDVIFEWWIAIERDQALVVLRAAFEEMVSSEDPGDNAAPQPAAGAGGTAVRRDLTLLHPAAESVLSLLHTIDAKAARLSSPAHRHRFTDGVGRPLCLEFMEMMNQDAAVARNGLLRRRTGVMTGVELGGNVERWISVVTSTHVVGFVVGRKKREEMVGGVVHKLRDAMVEEFGAAFVETVMMEKARLASYIMQCPFRLSCPPPPAPSGPVVSVDDVEEDDQRQDAAIDLSAGLVDSAYLLETLTSVCDEAVTTLRFGDHVSTALSVPSHLMTYAPRALQTNVVDRLTSKLLEIVEDDGAVPVVHPSGARILREDVRYVFGFFSSKTVGSDRGVRDNLDRLGDIVGLMAMDGDRFGSLRGGLCGLVGQGEDLYGGAGAGAGKGRCIDVEAFDHDAVIYEEGQSMLRAKGFCHVELREAIGVMNRRGGSEPVTY